MALHAVVLFVALSCGMTSTRADLDCKKLSSCSCQMNDGTGTIDLSPLASKNKDQAAFVQPVEGYVYTYNPCTGVDYNQANGTCQAKDNVAVCQVFDTGKGKGVSCGAQSEAAFNAYYDNEAGETKVNVTYQGGEGTRLATVILVCTGTEDPDFKFIAEDPPGHYNMVLSSSHCCSSGQHIRKKHSHNSMAISGGSILVILFFSLLVVYFVAGVLFQKYRREASGKELIPNYAFWSSLPGLIKDGVLFVFRKCRKEKPSGYEAL